MDTHEKYKKLFGQINQFFIDQKIKTTEVNLDTHFISISFLCIFRYLAEDAKRDFFKIETEELEDITMDAINFLIDQKLIEVTLDKFIPTMLTLSPELKKLIMPNGGFPSVFLTYPLHWYQDGHKDAKERRFGADLLDLFGLSKPPEENCDDFLENQTQNAQKIA